MFDVIATAYNNVFYLPLLNGLLFLISVLPGASLGAAVIILTLVIRSAMFPLTHKMVKTQQVMKKLEPEMKKIKNGKSNKEEQAKAIMDLYKKHGINPFSGFFMLFLQFPVLIALYHVFWKGIPFKAEEVYYFISIPAGINESFLGLVLLTEASMVFAALAALSQFFQAYLAMPPVEPGGQKKGDFASAMQKNMVYVFPAIIFIFAANLPAAVSLYWTTMNIFAIVHEAIVRRKGEKLLDSASDGREQRNIATS